MRRRYSNDEGCPPLRASERESGEESVLVLTRHREAERERNDADAQVADVQADEVGRHDVVVRVEHLCLLGVLLAELLERLGDTPLRARQDDLGAAQVAHPPVGLAQVDGRELEHARDGDDGDAHPVRGEAQGERAREREERAVGEDDVRADDDFAAPRQERKDVRVGDEDGRDPG